MLLMKLNNDLPEWMEKANCLEATDLDDPVEMGPLCKACPVSKECIEYAEDKEVGSLVWGARDFQTGEVL